MPKRKRHLDNGGKLDNPLLKYSDLRTPINNQFVSDNTRVENNKITNTDIDRFYNLKPGTTTLREDAEKHNNSNIQQSKYNNEVQKQINKSVQRDKYLKPLNNVLDIVENVPVYGNAVTAGRAISDIKGGKTLGYLSLATLGLPGLFKARKSLKNAYTNIGFNRNKGYNDIIKSVGQEIYNRHGILDNVPIANYNWSLNPLTYYNNLLKTSGYYGSQGIRMNPLFIFTDPSEYKGVVAHEARHSFENTKPIYGLSTSRGYEYLGPDFNFATALDYRYKTKTYKAILPFYNAAKQGKWHGSPNELIAEMAKWKYQNGHLGTSFKDMDIDEKTKYIIKAANRFKLNDDDATMSLINLSNAGYFKYGGKIHIKPYHRGRFTALKERTGHSTTWFKENGTPAQKKMATFALNAAKWKH